MARKKSSPQQRADSIKQLLFLDCYSHPTRDFGGRALHLIETARACGFLFPEETLEVTTEGDVKIVANQ